MTSQFYTCSCFLTNNYFLKQYNVHIRFINREQVKGEYEAYLISRGCNTKEKWGELFKDLELEHARRKRLDEDSKLRKETICKQYVPIHPEIFKLQEKLYLTPQFLKLVEECKTNKPTDPSSLTNFFTETHGSKQLYCLPVFTEEFCNKLIEEIINFENSPCPKGRPNTMNNYGILLHELGMDEFFNGLREEYLTPICRCLFHEWVGESGLDSHRAFSVTYKIGEDEDLAFHFDNAEVTLNFCLGRTFTGGKLFFGNMSTSPIDATTWTQVDNKPLYGILHRGRQRHGAAPISVGERYNLIIWMRSSSIRRSFCPMCNKPPTLVPGDGFADGFRQV